MPGNPQYELRMGNEGKKDIGLLHSDKVKGTLEKWAELPEKSGLHAGDTVITKGHSLSKGSTIRSTCYAPTMGWLWRILCRDRGSLSIDFHCGKWVAFYQGYTQWGIP